MKKVSPLNYTFAVGKVRVLENFLIRQQVFEEAIESELSRALELFTESDLYGEELLYTKNSQQLEALLSEELSKIKMLTRSLLLDKKLLCLLGSDSLSDLKQSFKQSDSQFLQDYFMYTVDMHNIKTFLRLYVLKEPEEKLKTYLIYEGFFKKKTFLELYSQDLSNFLHRLKYVHKHARVIDYAFFLEDAVKKLKEHNSFVALEKAINEFLIQVLKPAKYLSFGPEPVIAYYFAKVNEINLIRLIILAKLNNLTTDLVKERLNNVYA